MNRIALSLKDAETLYSTGKVSVFRRIRPQPTGVYQGSGTAYLMNVCPRPEEWDDYDSDPVRLIFCPWGYIGSELWVQESWCGTFDCDGDVGNVYAYRAGCHRPQDYKRWFSTFEGEFSGVCGSTGWLPSSRMPKWASRYTVVVESIEGVKLEGIWYWKLNLPLA